ncbi:hypothetical protein B2J93_1971 [Marssonina coronariae]|uniref:Uncharacterized protein n=1 Tax=Diplocarpon coronariae TaxID=2795749 RepID=A0A218ZGT4_9HELO|nr:hypothetical protein B2J93_1971 [Marssonina coronariae]
MIDNYPLPVDPSSVNLDAEFYTAARTQHLQMRKESYDAENQVIQDARDREDRALRKIREASFDRLLGRLQETVEESSRDAHIYRENLDGRASGGRQEQMDLQPSVSLPDTRSYPVDDVAKEEEERQQPSPEPSDLDCRDSKNSGRAKRSAGSPCGLTPPPERNKARCEDSGDSFDVRKLHWLSGQRIRNISSQARAKAEAARASFDFLGNQAPHKRGPPQDALTNPKSKMQKTTKKGVARPVPSQHILAEDEDEYQDEHPVPWPVAGRRSPVPRMTRGYYYHQGRGTPRDTLATLRLWILQTLGLGFQGGDDQEHRADLDMNTSDSLGTILQQAAVHASRKTLTCASSSPAHCSQATSWDPAIVDPQLSRYPRPAGTSGHQLWSAVPRGPRPATPRPVAIMRGGFKRAVLVGGSLQAAVCAEGDNASGRSLLLGCQ